MSLATLTPAGDFDDDSDAEFSAVVADFHVDHPIHRPTRAAERREAREQIDRQLGLRRHRSTEKEV